MLSMTGIWTYNGLMSLWWSWPAVGGHK